MSGRRSRSRSRGGLASAGTQACRDGRNRADAGRVGAAIAELRGSRVAERPPAHFFFQLHDRDAKRHRHDDIFVEARGLGVEFGLRQHRQNGIPPDDAHPAACR